jgi:hypothetical protein
MEAEKTKITPPEKVEGECTDVLKLITNELKHLFEAYICDLKASCDEEP